ncbi:MAG: 16S rRNA (adenine(1518)-N(6)/adenine(1519)-N(6))-dimethyltransferase RsmA [bacterium]
MKQQTFRPKKSLGQNFLVDENISRKIVHSVTPTPEQTFLEIGSGFGVLTKYLLPEVKKLIAVEIDRNLVSELQADLGAHDNFELVQGDFLRLEIAELAEAPNGIRVIGNIPYHITSPVIFKVFENRHLVQDMTLMIQKEVARRIAAKPCTKDYGILSVFSQVYARVELLFQVSRNVFSPKPEVDSAVVRWDFSPGDDRDIRSKAVFSQLVRGTFQQRRKMLRNSLSNLGDLQPDLQTLSFDLEKRPEELSPQEFVTLSNLICTNQWMKKI